MVKLLLVLFSLGVHSSGPHNPMYGKVPASAFQPGANNPMSPRGGMVKFLQMLLNLELTLELTIQ